MWQGHKGRNPKDDLAKFFLTVDCQLNTKTLQVFLKPYKGLKPHAINFDKASH